MLADTTFDSMFTSRVWLPLAIAGILLFWVVARIKRQQAQARKNASSDSRDPGRPSSDDDASSPSQTPGISARELRTVAGELNSLLVELHDTARQLAAQMDNRTTRLDALLAEADEKIKRLESLHAQITSDAPTSPRNPPAIPNATADEDPKYRRIYDLADRGHTPREIAAQVGAHPGEVELILNLRAKPTS